MKNTRSNAQKESLFKSSTNVLSARTVGWFQYTLFSANAFTERIVTRLSSWNGKNNCVSFLSFQSRRTYAKKHFNVIRNDEEES